MQFFVLPRHRRIFLILSLLWVVINMCILLILNMDAISADYAFICSVSWLNFCHGDGGNCPRILAGKLRQSLSGRRITLPSVSSFIAANFVPSATADDQLRGDRVRLERGRESSRHCDETHRGCLSTYGA